MEKQTEKGSLYLTPSLLGDSNVDYALPEFNRKIINSIRHYIAEREKTARRFLIKAGIETPIDSLRFFPLNKHTNPKETSHYLDPIHEGYDMGLISEAGCPGIADPGASIVQRAHEQNIRVVPLVGPSSILLALISSGFNGQSFVFHGYLPRDKKLLSKKLKQLESSVYQEHQTQIFMETPYRNMKMLDEILRTCSGHTKLCIACDLTLPGEFIKTKTIEDWKKDQPDLHKRPAVFLIYK